MKNEKKKKTISWYKIYIFGVRLVVDVENMYLINSNLYFDT